MGKGPAGASSPISKVLPSMRRIYLDPCFHLGSKGNEEERMFGRHATIVPEETRHQSSTHSCDRSATRRPATVLVSHAINPMG